MYKNKINLFVGLLLFVISIGCNNASSDDDNTGPKPKEIVKKVLINISFVFV